MSTRRTPRWRSRTCRRCRASRRPIWRRSPPAQEIWPDKKHPAALKKLQKTEKSTKDADLKAHLEKGAAHIKEHLDEAKKMQASLKKVASGA